MGIVKNEGLYVGDWLLYEDDDAGRYSRGSVVIPANTTILCGQPLETSGNNAVPHDGTGTFAGIALEGVVTGAGETKEIAVLVRHARVDTSQMSFGALAAPAKATIISQMAAAGIVETPPVGA